MGEAEELGRGHVIQDKGQDALHKRTRPLAKLSVSSVTGSECVV